MGVASCEPHVLHDATIIPIYMCSYESAVLPTCRVEVVVLGRRLRVVGTSVEAESAAKLCSDGSLLKGLRLS